MKDIIESKNKEMKVKRMELADIRKSIIVTRG